MSSGKEGAGYRRWCLTEFVLSGYSLHSTDIYTVRFNRLSSMMMRLIKSERVGRDVETTSMIAFHYSVGYSSLNFWFFIGWDSIFPWNLFHVSCKLYQIIRLMSYLVTVNVFNMKAFFSKKKKTLKTIIDFGLLSSLNQVLKHVLLLF